MRFRKTPRCAGFTLAEVVLGVLLLGMTTALLGRAVADSLRAVESARYHEPNGYPIMKVRHAMLRLPTRAQVEEGGELEVPTIRASQREGDQTETLMLRARWQAEVKPTRLLNVFQVALEIDIEGGENEAEKVESLIFAYRPGWVDAQELESLLDAKEEEFNDRRTARGETVEDEE